jgi:uncharacterized protein (DUF58 family)
MFRKFRQKIAFWQNPATSNQELILNRHRVYIFPNWTGIVYVGLLLAIFIASINYNLNLGHALNFILISCGWLGINLTFRNLSGTALSASPCAPVYLGELAHFPVHLTNRTKRDRYALQIGLKGAVMQVVDIAKFSSTSLTLASPTSQRGWMPCPRIQVQTVFPFGLLRAWSYWKTAQQVLVYPAPEINPPPLPYVASGISGTQQSIGSDDFAGVRNYRMGDSLKLLAWRQMARQSAVGNEVLISKNFEGGQQKICLLDFSELPAQLSTEQKLSRLCAWVLTAEREQVRYGFKLGQINYAQNSGEAHQLACLTALALFGVPAHE